MSSKNAEQQTKPRKVPVRKVRFANSDNQYLGAIPNTLSAAYVEEVHGVEAVEVPAFRPTRHELLILAQYWAQKATEVESDWTMECETTSGMGLQTFEWRRVSRISELLGEDLHNAIRDIQRER